MSACPLSTLDEYWSTELLAFLCFCVPISVFLLINRAGFPLYTYKRSPVYAFIYFCMYIWISDLQNFSRRRFWIFQNILIMYRCFPDVLNGFSANISRYWPSTTLYPNRVVEVAREHGWHPPKSLGSDKTFKPEHTLFCGKLRFVTIYALFGDLWAKKVPCFGQKQCFLGKKCTITWYILHISLK